MLYSFIKRHGRNNAGGIFMPKELVSFIVTGAVFGYFFGMISEQPGIGALLGAILSVLIAIYNQIKSK
jgi:F0F1-type ATP synthase assembly protein I